MLPPRIRELNKVKTHYTEEEKMIIFLILAFFAASLLALAK